MKTFLTTFYFFVGITCFAQDTLNEIPPTFKGGEETFTTLMAKNLRYPVVAKENAISGTTWVAFTILADGSVDSVRVTKSSHPALDMEAVRVVKLTNGHWSPGMVNHVPVNVQFNLPIKFSFVTYELERPSGNSLYLYNLGVKQYNKGKIDTAFKTFNKVLEYDSTFTDALYNCAVISIQKGDTATACQYLNRIKQSGKNDGDELIAKHCEQP